MLSVPGECWVITDDAAGNQRQALALAGYLNMPLRHLVLKPRAPWSWLAPRLTWGGTLALHQDSRALLAPPWPAVAIGCGRAAALFTRMLRPLSKGLCHTVQILDPRIATDHWDTVIAPRHDHVKGANVLHPLGSLNPIDERWLESGRESWPDLVALPQPRTGVLLGGPRRGVAMNESYIQTLGSQLLQRLQSEGGSMMVLASRRTPGSLIERMRQELATAPGLVWAGPEDGPNPYAGVLGWADRLVVTPDSVNMLSEACAVGCPVHSLVMSPLPPKLAEFHQSLRDTGRLHDINAAGSSSPPLRETSSIAATLVAHRLDRHGAASGAP